MPQVKTWIGSKPVCDFCGVEEPAIFMDAKCVTGQWSIMCPVCFEQYGILIRPGFGQQYKYNVNTKQWEKEAG